jgi:hypothetical protein
MLGRQGVGEWVGGRMHELLDLAGGAYSQCPTQADLTGEAAQGLGWALLSRGLWGNLQRCLLTCGQLTSRICRPHFMPLCLCTVDSSAAALSSLPRLPLWLRWRRTPPCGSVWGTACPTA